MMDRAEIILDFWASGPRATFWFRTRGGKVVDAAPIAKRCVGGDIKALVRRFRIDKVMIVAIDGRVTKIDGPYIHLELKESMTIKTA